MKDTQGSRTDYWTDAVIRGFLRVALSMPYRYRVPFFGWITSRLLAPVVGYNRRVKKNLDFIFPEMSVQQRKAIIRGVPDNIGRTLIEIYSGQEFIDRVKDLPLTGPGGEILERAHAENQPVILVTGHFGNYDVARAALIGRGYRVGGLYNRMHNPYFNSHYVKAIRKIGSPMFPKGRRGLGELVRFIKTGGMVGFVTDQHANTGVPMEFFGKQAATALSAAELALKYKALMVPIYGIRQENGLDFEIRVESPIEHSDPVTMTKALNESLEALIKQHPEQWLWVHRRWKLPGHSPV